MAEPIQAKTNKCLGSVVSLTGSDQSKGAVEELQSTAGKGGSNWV